jgi:TonB family protein
MEMRYTPLLLSALLTLNSFGSQQIHNKVTDEKVNTPATDNAESQHRKPLPIRKEVSDLLQQAFNYLVPPEGNQNVKEDPKKSLSILENHDLKDLNPNELAQIHLFKAYAFEALGKYKKSISEFLLVIDSSPQISVSTEAQALKSLWLRYASLGKSSESVKIFHRWTKLTDEIDYEESKIISKMLEAEGDISSAIAYLSKAIELAKTDSSSVNDDYFQLARLYRLNNQHAEADSIQDKFITPMYTVAHTYPTGALNRGIQGYCTVTFDVTSAGTTSNIHIKPGDCMTSTGKVTDIFSQSSISAIKKFKYKPKIENGQAIEMKAVTYKFSYKIAR